MRKIILILLCVVLQGLWLNAQDIHFSQFGNSPVMINPAQTGFFNGAHRFTSNYRSQWGSFTVPFRTFSFSYDMQPAYRLIKNDMLGVGAWVYGDKAGDSDHGILQTSLSLSYIFSLNESDNNHLGVGFLSSWAQRQMSYDKLYFDQQFNGEYFDPSLPTGEDKGTKSYSYFDFNVGVHWRYQPGKDNYYNAGVSFSHITRPSQTFQNNETSRLPMKTIAYGNLSVPFDAEHAIVPGFMSAFQGTASEIVVGMDYRYTLAPKKYNYTALSPGLYYRTGDALILAVQLDYQHWRFGVSYDMNISDLSNASRGLGGLEMAIIYKLPRTDIHRRDAIPCPIF
ncbi:MAG: PorP/SprF family type IX secretion system membrane protein [Bacteroidales bacterium]